MTKKRVAMELGMGTSLRRQDYTKAAVRALQDALWHNSLTVADAFGFSREDMIIEVDVAVQQPTLVDIDTVKAVLPYGQPHIRVVHGGLDIPKPPKPRKNFADTEKTVIAQVAVNVYFDMEPADGGTR